MIPQSNDMRVEVSTLCNYKCVICPHGVLTRKKEVMSTELFRDIFDRVNAETDQYNTLTFPGMGEPLLDKRLEDKIAYAKSKKPDLTVLLLTNGALLSPERFRRLEDLGVASVRVSFYGSTARGYSAVHGVQPEVFERMRANIVEICRQKRTTDLLMTYNVVDGKNDADVQGWIDFWKDKADLLEVWRPHNWADARKYRPLQERLTKTCGRPFQGPLQIQVDGTVNMCCFDFDGKLTLGDLKTQRLAEIFSSPLFQKITAAHETGNYVGSHLICEHCDQRNVDKSDVMVFNSKFDVRERVTMTSTTYKKVAN
ncbi:MAG: radical SAM protein [Candidatus Omnitrophica bacterium]|nr:radical SAM protein [Candidatus Omnitrophota bacterium]